MKLELDTTEEETMALAQFVKRVGWNDDHPVDDAREVLKEIL